MTGVGTTIGYRRKWGPPKRPRLTCREDQVLRMVVEGKRNQEIGECLGISMRTVKTHLSNIYKKFGVNRRFEATAVLFSLPTRKQGLLDVQDLSSSVCEVSVHGT